VVRRNTILSIGIAALAALISLVAVPVRADDAAAQKPTIYIIGDSTVHNPGKGLKGWGDAIGAYFDPAKIAVENDAIPGRSSRTYLSEGHWDKVLAKLKPGDFVFMQFGHNDGGAVSGDKATGRASLKGTGDQMESATDPKTGATIDVHTYGWYLKNYAETAKAKGALPILVSPIPRNIPSSEGKFGADKSSFSAWSEEIAKTENVPFVGLNAAVVAKYNVIGAETVKASYFPGDHTHTSPAGAELNAQCVIDCLKALPTNPLAAFLSPNPPVVTLPTPAAAPAVAAAGTPQ